MRTIKLTAASFIILFVFSCASGEKESSMEENSSIKKVQVTEFPETIDLTSNLDSVYISNPLFKVRKMITTNDHLISMNSEEPLFSVYNNLTAQYIGSFGFAGEGHHWI